MVTPIPNSYDSFEQTHLLSSHSNTDTHNAFSFLTCRYQFSLITFLYALRSIQKEVKRTILKKPYYTLYTVCTAMLKENRKKHTAVNTIATITVNSNNY